MSGYVNTGALTTTDWLAEHLDDPQVAVIEVDEDTTAYDGAHIPGAVALDWRQELHAHPEREFVSATALADLLGGKGVGTNRAIVLYGGNHNWFAAYAYWLFRLRGIDTVRSLDGGRMKWERDGRALTRRVPDRARTEFRTGRELPQLRVFRDEVITHAGNGGATLVDVRSPEEYSGKVLAPPHLPQEQPYVGGHIPGREHPQVAGGPGGRLVPSSGRAAHAVRRRGHRRQRRRDHLLSHR